ncbi:MAG: hypothetical protein GC160_27240 [Acidobacteria bacterium]|nr:hypothetical protein [Acidobacteriota bacterium]
MLRWLIRRRPLALLLLLAATVPAGAADPLALLPATADAVLGANLAAARGSAIFERLAGRFELDAMAGGAGVDPSRDIDRLTVALWGAPGREKSFLAVLEGQPGWQTRSKALLEGYREAGEVDGVRLLTGRAREGGPELTLAFLDETTAMVGDRAAVEAGVERRHATAADSLRQAGVGVPADAAAARGQLWMVAREPAKKLPSQSGMPSAGLGAATAMLSSLETLSFSADVRSGLDVTLLGKCGTAAEATSLAALTQAMLAMARMSAPATEPEMQSLLSGAKVAADSDVLTISMRMEEGDFFRLLDAAKLKRLEEEQP